MSTERRLLVRSIGDVGSIVALDEGAAHHVRVLRITTGASIVVFDGRGASAEATLVAEGDALNVRIERMLPRAAAATKLVLVQCLPKAGKIDDIVRGATELGVDTVRLATSDRAIAKADERWERKHARLVRIAEEASRQSERVDVPTILAPAPVLDHAAAAPASARKLTLCGRSGTRPQQIPTEEIWLVVGPEGGLSDRELAALDALSYERTSISTTILRVETASVAALAVARLLTGNDGDR